MIQAFYFFMVCVALALKPEKYELFSHEYNLALSLFYILLLIVFITHQRLRDRNWLRFDVIFLIGYTIVHFQIPFLASIGIEPNKPYLIWVNKNVVNYATWMSSVAISLWVFGYSLITKSKYKAKVISSFSIDFKLLDIVLFLVYLGFLLSVGKNFFGGAYDVNSWGGAAAYFLIILKVLITLRIVYFFMLVNPQSSYRQIIKKVLNNKVFAGVVITYTLLFFITGSRGEILQVLLVTAFAYSIFVKPISFKFIIIFILTGSFIFTLMGLGRGGVATELDNQSLLQRGYSELYESDSKINFTNELASSIRIQYRALDSVPNYHPYLYGVPYALTLFSPIPFAGSLIINTFEVPYQYQATSRFFTYLRQGNHITSGDGSEILADIYVNFGLVGMFIIMFSFGVFSGKVTIEARSANFNYFLIYMILLTTALAMNRGTIFYVYTGSFYIFLLHYFFSGKFKWKK